MVYFVVAIGAIVLIILIFACMIGISLTLGMRNQHACYYDPEIKEWVPAVLLTEEQQSRIISGSRKLSKRNKVSEYLKSATFHSVG